MQNLAIVIPAYKDQFLDKTLTCFANQTNKNFRLYIGDDNSPVDLKAISDKYCNELEIIYHRFDNNIGAKNLVKQWTRCIDLTETEEWIWLFSDDDLVDNHCVDNFFKAIESDDLHKTDIYRFNTVVINRHDEVILRHDADPSFETSEQMAYNLLLSKRSNSLADHIFSRKVYLECGGLVYTEYAQGADWAMSILFSRRNGINVIEQGNFYWRYSGSNISSNIGTTKTKMLPGHLQFVRWTAHHFSYLKNSNKSVTYPMMIGALKENLKNVLIFHFKGFSVGNIKGLIDTMHDDLNMSYIEITNELLLIFKVTSAFANRFSSFKKHLRLMLK